MIAPRVQEHPKAAGVDHFVLAGWRRGDRAKELHRRFGARSRGELIAHALGG